MNILVVDLGYGGMAIATKLYEKLKDLRLNINCKIIFHNIPCHNKFISKEDKVLFFSIKLKELDNMYKPDLVLIACNTLSIILKSIDGDIFNNDKIIDITEMNTKYLEDKIKLMKFDTMITFASEITLSNKFYDDIFIDNGIKPDNIVSVPCKNLAVNIEFGDIEKNIKPLVYYYAKKSIEYIQNINDITTNIGIFLGCTHYGYVGDIFKEAFEYFGINNFHILNSEDFINERIVNIVENYAQFNDKRLNELIIPNGINEKAKKNLHRYLKVISEEIANKI